MLIWKFRYLSSSEHSLTKQKVLNESHWPISGTQKFPLLLGQQLMNCQAKFQEFYDKNTEKRRLQWLYNYGTVTLAGRFTNSKLPIQLVMTPLQVVLCRDCLDL